MQLIRTPHTTALSLHGNLCSAFSIGSDRITLHLRRRDEWMDGWMDELHDVIEYSS